MPGGSAGAVGTHEGILQGAKQSLWKTERFERAETEDREGMGAINVGVIDKVYCLHGASTM